MRGVPITEVRYRYDGVPRRYWVYGSEGAVYCPDYPQGTCNLCCAKIGDNKTRLMSIGGSLGMFLIVLIVVVVIVIVNS